MVDNKLLEWLSASTHCANICIDLSFNNSASKNSFHVTKEINSIAKQLGLAYSNMKKYATVSDSPVLLQLTSVPSTSGTSPVPKSDPTADDSYKLALSESLSRQSFENWKVFHLSISSHYNYHNKWHASSDRSAVCCTLGTVCEGAHRDTLPRRRDRPRRRGF